MTGFSANMVGTRQYGRNMKDNDHETTSRAKLAAIPGYFEHSKNYKPNIVLINVGTNNANDNDQANQAYQLMGSIVDEIWRADGMSQTCVMLLTLLPTNHPTGIEKRLIMNDAYRRVVREKAKAGKCIYLADMEPAAQLHAYQSKRLRGR
ncbi:hypothetical protein ACJ41O_000966 [Fusarium nematophilum]